MNYQGPYTERNKFKNVILVIAGVVIPSLSLVMRVAKVLKSGDLII